MSSIAAPSSPEKSRPNAPSGFKAPPGDRSIRVWDLPTRLFHWSLAILVPFCLVSGQIGVTAMPRHLTCGEAIVFLLVFRLIWGFAGSAPSRFTAFVRGPKTVWAYAKTLGEKRVRSHPGHNPLGGWSVVAMLLALLIQALTGLFSNDDIFLEGPLAPWVSESLSDWLTRVHSVNQKIVIVLVTTHVAAIFFYWIHKGENLIWPMINGRKDCGTEAQQPEMKSAGLAVFIAGLLGVGTYLLVAP